MSKFLHMIIFTLLIAGCEKDRQFNGDYTDYSGVFIITDVDFNVESTMTDYVTLRVVDDQYYLAHHSGESNMCDSYGIIEDLNTDTISLYLDMDQYDDAKCIYYLIPSGEFNSIYNGENLKLGPKTFRYYTGGCMGHTRTRTYEFNLVRQ